MTDVNYDGHHRFYEFLEHVHAAYLLDVRNTVELSMRNFEETIPTPCFSSVAHILLTNETQDILLNMSYALIQEGQLSDDLQQKIHQLLIGADKQTVHSATQQIYAKHSKDLIKMHYDDISENMLRVYDENLGQIFLPIITLITAVQSIEELIGDVQAATSS